jgi:predicted metal-dependent hydrolase
MTLELDAPTLTEIKALIKLTLEKTKVKFDNQKKINAIEKKCIGLSYYTIQRTLLTAMKRSLLDLDTNIAPKEFCINTAIWEQLIDKEKNNIEKQSQK